MAPIIEVENLHQRYGDVVAVDEVSFSVHEGEIFDIIGPNGAGKTTTVESVIGLRKPDRGRISVLGMDPIRERTALAERIGVQLQEAALAERIKVWEALDLFSSFYRRTVPWQPLLQQWGLADKRNAMFANLSGGQRQRLFIRIGTQPAVRLDITDCAEKADSDESSCFTERSPRAAGQSAQGSRRAVRRASIDSYQRSMAHRLPVDRLRT